MRRGPDVTIPEPDLPDVDGGPRDRTTRWISVLMVSTMFLTALVGIALAHAMRSDDDAAAAADRFGILAQSATVDSQRAADTAFAAFVRGDIERQRAVLAMRWSQVRPDAAMLGLAAERWSAHAGRTALVTEALVSALPEADATSVSPDADPGFPNRLYAESARRPLELEALQDASSDLASHWSAKVTSYVTIVALLAAALYLFGFAHTLDGWVRAAVASLGVGLLIWAAGWTTAEVVDVPRPAPHAAAAAYADGGVLLGRATRDHEAYEEAERSFTIAIRQNPRLALAWLGRSVATYFAASPQAGTFASITDDDALARSTEDLLEARDLGLDSLGVTNNLAANYFHLGLRRDDPAFISTSVELGQEAVRLAPTLPLVRFNLAAYLFAAGRIDEAVERYAEAADLPTVNGPDVAVALTVLDELARYRPGSTGDVSAAKSSVVSAFFDRSSSSGTPSTSALTGATAFVRADGPVVTGLQLDAGSTDDVVVVWYVERPDGSAYLLSEFPQIAELQPSGDGTYLAHARSVALSYPPRCLPDGRYRAEVYVGGVLAGAVRTPSTELAVEDVVVLRDANVAVCVPAGWSLAPQRAETPFRTVRDDDGIGVAMVATLPLPSGAPATSFEDLTRRTVAMVVDSEGRRLFGSAKVEGQPPERQYFMGLEAPSVRWYEYDGGLALSGGGIDVANGMVQVVVVAGPREGFETGGELAQLFESLSVIQRP